MSSWKDIKEAFKPDLTGLEEIKLNKDLRVAYNFTLSRETRWNLALLANKDCRSMSSMIEILVRDAIEYLKVNK